MSNVLIQDYLNQLSDLRRLSGTHREMVVREAFKDLLKGWARSLDLVFIPEYELRVNDQERRYVDGALLHALRVPVGYWEAKDEADDLNAEIALKFSRGYPQDNIIFEDSREAVLIQNRRERARCAVDNVTALESLLEMFFGYERPEIARFRTAVQQFAIDLPAVLDALRAMIEATYSTNQAFREAAERFLVHAKEVINPNIVETDVREMLIQHILTEEIFSKVYDEDDFHRQNNVAKELYALESVFFVGDLKKRTLRALDPYYAAIRSTAAQIASHHEKQAFVKLIYENFYRVYNPKAADRLGVVYTPNEIVRFMVEGADWLCEKNFSRNLIDHGVDILDPATGTGTFVCELLERFRGQSSKMRAKYRDELHANEVAILPYYVANLNIEATYAALTGEYLDFPNLCFVDTLDNVGRHTAQRGTTLPLFGAVSEENVLRIKRQNSKRISVVIGNPPYNANQLNENDNNKNRLYPEIDKRIKDTYIAASKARKTKAYDMYARFFRWSSDRLDKNGVIAFITNRSFLDKRTYDGFRRTVAKEFNDIYVLDLGGDVRDNPKLSGTKHNVFGIQTGVAISFMVRRASASGCHVHYARRSEFETATEKLSFLGRSRLAELEWDTLRPDDDGVWLKRSTSDFDSLVPVANQHTKASKKRGGDTAIFKLHSLGISTNRDEWVLDHSRSALEEKVRYLVRRYDELREKAANGATGEESFAADIKWSRNLKRRFNQGHSERFDTKRIVRANYRPFVTPWLYNSRLFVDEHGAIDRVFGGTDSRKQRAITIIGDATEKPFSVLAVDMVADLHFLSPAAGTTILPLYRFEEGQAVENITNWSLKRFKEHYRGERIRKVTKETIFYYVYAVLHDPVYRAKYEVDLRRSLPSVPLYPGFQQWCDWGSALMELHLGYKDVAPFPLERHEHTGRARKQRTFLHSDAAAGEIYLDSSMKLRGVPRDAWRYSFGTRSAIDWVLDQYKESPPRDPTLRSKFHQYRFAEFRGEVVDLLERVVAVSVATLKIVDAMRDLPR